MRVRTSAHRLNSIFTIFFMVFTKRIATLNKRETLQKKAKRKKWRPDDVYCAELLILCVALRCHSLGWPWRTIHDSINRYVTGVTRYKPHTQCKPNNNHIKSNTMHTQNTHNEHRGMSHARRRTPYDKCFPILINICCLCVSVHAWNGRWRRLRPPTTVTLFTDNRFTLFVEQF